MAGMVEAVLCVCLFMFAVIGAYCAKVLLEQNRKLVQQVLAFKNPHTMRALQADMEAEHEMRVQEALHRKDPAFVAPSGMNGHRQPVSAVDLMEQMEQPTI